MNQNHSLARQSWKQPELAIMSESLDHIIAGHHVSGITLTYPSWHLSPRYWASRSSSRRAPCSWTTNGFRWTIQQHRFPLSKRNASSKLQAIRFSPTAARRINGDTPYRSCDPRFSALSNAISISTAWRFQVPGGVRASVADFSLHRGGAAYPNPNAWDHTHWLYGETSGLRRTSP